MDKRNLAQVERDGFAIFNGVIDDAHIDRILDHLAQTDVVHSRAGIRHLMADLRMRAIATDSRLIQIASDGLRTAAVPFRATLFDKSQDANWKVVWHQDTALPLTEKKEKAGWGPWSVKDRIHYAHATTAALEKVIALRIHLDASTGLNGPLRVIPGSHTLGVLSDEEVSERTSRSEGVSCLAPKGAVLTMRPLLIHSSSKSKSLDSRRVLHIEYATSLKIGDGLHLAIA